MIIRPFKKDDYSKVYALWEKCNIELGISDREEEIVKFIELNPKTSLVAEIDGIIMSSVLGGYDGRRGLIHHLAVDPNYQKRGYGKEIVHALEKAFEELKVVKVSFWIKTNNLKVIDFYKKLGYIGRDDLITMSKAF